MLFVFTFFFIYCNSLNTLNMTIEHTVDNCSLKVSFKFFFYVISLIFVSCVSHQRQRVKHVPFIFIHADAALDDLLQFRDFYFEEAVWFHTLQTGSGANQSLINQKNDMKAW